MKKSWIYPTFILLDIDNISSGNNMNRVESVVYCDGAATATYVNTANNPQAFMAYAVAGNGAGGATTSNALDGCS